MAKNRVRDYLIHQKIGEGGMGRVFLGEHLHIKQKVAVKMVHPHLRAQPQFLERFRREAQLQASLQHPGIIAIHDFFIENGQAFMVSAFFPGQSLETILANHGRCSAKDTVRIILPVLNALNFAHAKGIIHHDVKPGNILVSNDGAIKVTDFGLAELGTETNRNLGSPAYMSPERLTPGQPVDHTSDVYSIGVLMFEMLTGQLPFEDPDPQKLAELHRTAPIPDVHQLRQDIDPALAGLVTRALAKKPEDRFHGCGELAGYLSEIAQTSVPNRTKPTSNPSTAETALELDRAAPAPLNAATPFDQPKPNQQTQVEGTPQPVDRSNESKAHPTVTFLFRIFKSFHTLTTIPFFLFVTGLAVVITGTTLDAWHLFGSGMVQRFILGKVNADVFTGFRVFSIIVALCWFLRSFPYAEQKASPQDILVQRILPWAIGVVIANICVTEALWRLAMPGWLKILGNMGLFQYESGLRFSQMSGSSLLMLTLFYFGFLLNTVVLARWTAELGVLFCRFTSTPKAATTP